MRGGVRRRRLGRQRRHERRERRRRQRRPTPGTCSGHRAIADTARYRPARRVAARIDTHAHIGHAAPDWLPAARAPPQLAAPLAAAIVIAPVALPRCRVFPRVVLLCAAVLVRRGVGGAPPLATTPVFRRGVLLLSCRRARSPGVGTPPAAVYRGAWTVKDSGIGEFAGGSLEHPRQWLSDQWPGPSPWSAEPARAARHALGRCRSRARAPPRGTL